MSEDTAISSEGSSDLTSQQQPSLNGILANISVGLSTLKGSVDSIKEDLSKVKEDLSMVKEDLSKVKEDLSMVKEDLSMVKEDLSEVKEDLSKVKEDLSKVKGSVALSSVDLGTVKEDLSKLRDSAGLLVERTTRTTVAEMFGRDWSLPRSFERLTDVLVWPASIVPADEGVMSKWLTSLLSVVETALPDFLQHLWQSVYDETSSLPLLSEGNHEKWDHEMRTGLVNLSNRASLKGIKTTREEKRNSEALIKVIDETKTYFFSLKGEKQNGTRNTLLAHPRSPGLSILIWLANNKSEWKSSLEFDCQGSITYIPSKGREHVVIFCQGREIKTSLADKQKAVSQLKIRMRTMSKVLEVTLGKHFAQRRLLGYVFYSKNGEAPPDSVSDGGESSSDVAVKFVRIQ
jgi:archaellum component FlaC